MADWGEEAPATGITDGMCAVNIPTRDWNTILTLARREIDTIDEGGAWVPGGANYIEKHLQITNARAGGAQGQTKLAQDLGHATARLPVYGCAYFPIGAGPVPANLTGAGHATAKLVLDRLTMESNYIADYSNGYLAYALPKGENDAQDRIFIPGPWIKYT